MKKKSNILKPSNSSSSSSKKLPEINNNQDPDFRKNKEKGEDERFNLYFKNKYANSQSIMQTFQKTLSNYSFLGLKLTEKPNSSMKSRVKPSELFLDNYIGHRHNKKPFSSQSNRSNVSNSTTLYNKILPNNIYSEDRWDMKIDNISEKINLLLENSERFSQINSIFANLSQKNSSILTIFNEYWEFLGYIDRDLIFSGFANKKLQKIIKHSLIYEIIYMSLAHYLFFVHSNSAKQERILNFIEDLSKKIGFIFQNYDLLLSLFMYFSKNIQKTENLIEFQILKENLKKKIATFDFNELIKKIIYNNKVLECFSKEIFHVLLIRGGNYFENSSIFEIYEFFLSTDINEIELKNLKLLVIQTLTKILKPAGFFTEKDQMKDIFLTGTFSNLNIENLEFETKSNALPPIPFLSLNTTTKEYSLVLELEGVLLISKINDENEISFEKRPHVDEFLKEMSSYYEIIVYSVASKEFVEQALEFLDPQKLVKYKLSGEHTVKHNNLFVKDLNLIGRDLKKVLCIDFKVENFQFQKDNGIFIKKWEGDEKDECLTQLSDLLKHFAKKQFKDLSKVLINYRDKAIRLLWNGINIELI